MDKVFSTLLDLMIMVFALALALVMNTGCVSEGFAAGQPGVAERLRSGEWTLIKLMLNGSETLVPPGKITLLLNEDGKVSGSGGCNRYSSSIQVDEKGAIHFGNILSTKMFCTDTMQIETGFFNALALVDRITFEGNQLVLASGDGSTRLVLRK
jgi:heat shock protein HslJ